MPKYSIPLSDGVRLAHITQACGIVGHFVQARVRSDLDTDVQFLFALLHAMEVIGEAASRVSKSTRDLAPDIPWGAIIGMRNRIAHAYFSVDNDLVWLTATVEIPETLVSINRLLDITEVADQPQDR